VVLRNGARDLHSSLFGGAALNAAHALIRTLDALVAHDGVLDESLRKGIVAPTPAELAGRRELPAGGDALASQGARPDDARAAEEFYLRTFAEPALDVNGITPLATVCGDHARCMPRIRRSLALRRPWSTSILLLTVQLGDMPRAGHEIIEQPRIGRRVVGNDRDLPGCRSASEELPRRVSEIESEALHPAVDAHVIDRDGALGQQFHP
jgi:hypothetical protein